MTSSTRGKKLVLLVEDSQAQAFQTRALLVANGLQVIMAEGGMDGIELAQQSQPDIIILDLELPDINGIEVARQLKQAEETNQIPIIILTRYDSQESVSQGLEIGVTDYIPKDAFSKIVLVETLKQMGVIHHE